MVRLWRFQRKGSCAVVRPCLVTGFLILLNSVARSCAGGADKCACDEEERELDTNDSREIGAEVLV